jgi:hypothetical protein
MVCEDPGLLLFPPNEIVTLCGFPHSQGRAMMTAIAMDESSTSVNPAGRWMVLLLLLFGRLFGRSTAASGPARTEIVGDGENQRLPDFCYSLNWAL